MLIGHWPRCKILEKGRKGWGRGRGGGKGGELTGVEGGEWQDIIVGEK